MPQSEAPREGQILTGPLFSVPMRKVAHYWPEIHALSACNAQAGMTKSMTVREEQSQYGDQKI